MITDEQIRNEAYFLWERAGKPDGMELYFWNQAYDKLNSEEMMEWVDVIYEANENTIVGTDVVGYEGGHPNSNVEAADKKSSRRKLKSRNKTSIMTTPKVADPAKYGVDAKNNFTLGVG